MSGEPDKDGCTVWLVERSDMHGCFIEGPRTHYLFRFAAQDGWTTDVHQATRFATREEAEATLDAKFGQPVVRVIEHIFGLTIPAPKSPDTPVGGAAYDLVKRLGCLPHPGDDGCFYPDNVDDDHDTLCGLIAEAREIMASAPPAEIESIRLAVLALCAGHPHAKIAWPHRELHAIADRLAALSSLHTGDKGSSAKTPIPTAPDQAGVVGDWRTIETAPRDGTEVLVWTGRFARVARFIQDWGWMAVGGRQVHSRPTTHWQPLPAAPASDTTAGDRE